MNEFEMPDGRTVTVDFCSTESILSIHKADWIEINRILKWALERVCATMSGREVFDLLYKNKT